MKSHILSVFALFASLSASAAYLDGTVGYLQDSEDMIYTGRIGTEMFTSGVLAHNAEIEVGFIDESEGVVDVSVIPLMANYRLETPIVGDFFFSGGAGAGVANIDVEFPGIEENKTTFVMQVFAGVGYTLSPELQFMLSARYFWVDDITIRQNRIEMGDDVAVEAGARFRF
ncbi:MAG: outer membrane beta-barrel protein [Opitutales bacterium]|nr:outer membrane beta-barrel protein [Opitutales bacterium]